jgi:hypothetical protein
MQPHLLVEHASSTSMLTSPFLVDNLLREQAALKERALSLTILRDECSEDSHSPAHSTAEDNDECTCGDPSSPGADSEHLHHQDSKPFLKFSVSAILGSDKPSPCAGTFHFLDKFCVNFCCAKNEKYTLCFHLKGIAQKLFVLY